MRQLLLCCLGVFIIAIQTLIGARAFFPEIFDRPADAAAEILASKKSILPLASPEDLAFLADHPVARVGVDPNFYPLEMFDERGRYTGLGGDYMRILGAMTGIRFEPEPAPNWAAAEEKAAKGDIDVFMAAASTGRRDEYMQFTPPYIVLPGILMTRKDTGPEKLDIGKMAGKKVAVTKDYSWHDFLREFHPEIIALPVATTLEGLRLVAAGEADAILDYEFNLLEKMRTAGILQLRKAGEVNSSYGHAVAANRSKPQLFNVISLAMAQISPAEKEALARKWLEAERPAGRGKHLQWVFFFFSEAFLLCAGLLWLSSRRVRNAVKACGGQP